MVDYTRDNLVGLQYRTVRNSLDMQRISVGQDEEPTAEGTHANTDSTREADDLSYHHRLYKWRQRLRTERMGRGTLDTPIVVSGLPYYQHLFQYKQHSDQGSSHWGTACGRILEVFVYHQWSFSSRTKPIGNLDCCHISCN